MLRGMRRVNRVVHEFGPSRRHVSPVQGALWTARGEPTAAWAGQRKLALERVDRLREELAGADSVDLPMLAVATSELRSLI